MHSQSVLKFGRLLMHCGSEESSWLKPIWD